MPYYAKFPGLCGRCHLPFGKGDPVQRRRDDFIHVTCASGQDDE